MRYSLLLIVLLLTISGFSQNPYAVAIDKTCGLTSNSVFDIFQDSKGFMWFATGKGLCRYDGNHFKTFTADFQTSKSGSCIQEDQYGRIWYENFDGFLYYVEKGTLKSLPQKTVLGYFRYGIIENELFLIQPGAVFIYDLKTLNFKTKYAIDDKIIKFCYATKENFYVLGDFLYEFEGGKSGKKINLPALFCMDIQGPIISNWNKKLLINSKNNSNYYCFENGTFSKKTLNTSFEFIQNTAVIDNSMWVCTPNGVVRNDLNSNKKTTYFKEQNISFVYKDKHNNYWISTINKGILFVKDFSNNLISLEPKPLSLTLGKNEVFIGTEKDLVYKLECQNLKISKIFETENNHSIGQIFADTVNDNLFFNSFQFNILNKNNELKSQFKIAIKDIKKVDNKYFSFAASSVSGLFFIDEKLKSSWDFIFDKNKNILFSGFNQAYLIKNSNGKSTEYNEQNNTVYYATNTGLKAIRPDGVVKELKYNNEVLFLTRIQKYKDKILGLSTSEKLYSINSKNEVFLFELPNLIAKEKFNKFFIRSHYCYLFSSNSVYELDFETNNTQKIMTLSDDIEATDVILKNNRLLFATSKGIIIKNRNEIKDYLKPKLIIDGIYVNEKRVEINQLNALNTDQNDVTIAFASLSFIPNVKYTVSYKINESNWKTLEINDKNLKLSSLSPGNYTILMAINYNSTKIAVQTIEFEINKPLWLNPMVLIGLGLLFLLIIVIFYKRQIKTLERRNKLQLERINLENNLNQSKLIAIKSQMNPHFFYNALNTIQSFILSNDKKQALNYLSKFSTLTRTILEMTEKETISIAEEMATLRLYLDIEKARFEEDFEYQINFQNISAFENQKIPTMLLQPYLENAIKHGLLHKSGLKKLTISFLNQQDSIRIEIDDNGIGRQQSNELNAIKNKNHISFATKAMQNRIEILNKNKTKKITINFIDKLNQSNQSLGTTVIIEIPFN